jgi:23S rRNA (cytosine1962-C5)-methyltransferase
LLPRSSSVAFRPTWLVHEDPDLFVVHKPAAVSLSASESESRDDLLARLRAYLGERDGIDPGGVYLGSIDPLERDASGLVIVTRRREANAWLQGLLERGAVRKSWLVAVAGPSRCLAAAARGTAHGRAPSGEARVRAESRGRALLEVEPDRGTARHARAIASGLLGLHARAEPEGVEGRRACPWPWPAHAERIRLAGRPGGPGLDARVDAPALFDSWLSAGVIGPPMSASRLSRALEEAAVRREPLARPGDVEALRLLCGAADGVPGVDVEVYGDDAVVWLDEQLDPFFCDAVLDQVHALGARAVWAKVRPRNRRQVGELQRGRFAPERAARGQGQPGPTAVHEKGMRFEVRLGGGLHTGLFLDQRENRAWLAARCAGSSVLNLFAYTCAFTVAAARGGASRTVSVDASARALEVGRRNLALNGVESGRHELVCEDVLHYLGRARARGESFDIVVLDPPSFSTARGGSFSVMRDYVSVAQACVQVLAPRGGGLLACANRRGVTHARLAGWVAEGARRAGRAVAGVRALAAPVDFPQVPGVEAGVRAVWVRIGQGPGKVAGTSDER